jgi:predicted dienelactone hydrolase
MGKLNTVFDDETRVYVYRKSQHLHGQDRHDFICEAERELWDFMPFDWDEIKQTINRVFRKYVTTKEAS